MRNEISNKWFFMMLIMRSFRNMAMCSFGYIWIYKGLINYSPVWRFGTLSWLLSLSKTINNELKHLISACNWVLLVIFFNLIIITDKIIAWYMDSMSNVHSIYSIHHTYEEERVSIWHIFDTNIQYEYYEWNVKKKWNNFICYTNYLS